MTVETVELAPGYRISRILRGGWQLAGGHGPVDVGAIAGGHLCQQATIEGAVAVEGGTGQGINPLPVDKSPLTGLQSSRPRMPVSSCQNRIHRLLQLPGPVGPKRARTS